MVWDGVDLESSLGLLSKVNIRGSEFNRNRHIANYNASSGLVLAHCPLAVFRGHFFSYLEHAAGKLSSSSVIRWKQAESMRHTVTA